MLVPDPEVDLASWIGSIELQSLELARDVERAGWDLEVPTCPSWQVRDLVRHQGFVHRWALAHVAEARERAMGKDEEALLMASPPPDPLLLGWFQEGSAQLVQALRQAPPSLSCWAFLPAPSPLSFWARRQAHETEIHRADAAAALGEVAAFAPPLAADGVEELLFGFGRRFRFPGATAQLLRLEAADGPWRWTLRLGPERLQAERGASGECDCSLRATASQLYLLLWNRLAADALEVRGDAAPLVAWRERGRVTWT